MLLAEIRAYLVGAYLRAVVLASDDTDDTGRVRATVDLPPLARRDYDRLGRDRWRRWAQAGYDEAKGMED